VTSNRVAPASAPDPNDFDARAATWDDDPTKLARARAIADAIEREVPLADSMTALEYGAGTGLLGFMLRHRFSDLTLADVSDGMLEIAAKKIVAAGDARMRAVKLDLLSDSLPQRRFDAVFSAMTLHHISDTQGILRRFHAVLKRPGFLCVADLDAEDGSFHGAGFDGHRGFDRKELETKTRAAGFASVPFATAHEMSKAVAGGSRTFPIFLMIAGTG
jgi:ubiquinone/menaquinone biosynthesis C-methylase UbiE